jgi:hypothetical protein
VLQVQVFGPTHVPRELQTVGEVANTLKQTATSQFAPAYPVVVHVHEFDPEQYPLPAQTFVSFPAKPAQVYNELEHEDPVYPFKQVQLSVAPQDPLLEHTFGSVAIFW